MHSATPVCLLYWHARCNTAGLYMPGLQGQPPGGIAEVPLSAQPGLWPCTLSQPLRSDPHCTVSADTFWVPFEGCAKGDAVSFMCSYNMVRGKKELGWSGKALGSCLPLGVSQNAA